MIKTLKEQMAVMQAADEGKEIEVDPKNGYGWLPLQCLEFNWAKYDYRVKPETQNIELDNPKSAFPYNDGFQITDGAMSLYLSNEDVWKLAKFRPAPDMRQDTEQFTGVDPLFREYANPSHEDWYRDGIADNEEMRLSWWKKGHRSGWQAHEKALEERP